MGRFALKKKPKSKVVASRESPKGRPERQDASAKKEAARRIEQERRQHQLVRDYYPYATSIANRVAQTLSSAVDYDDVLCNARVGLLEAAQRFDATQGIEFRTFAYYRIKGAIYDGLRKSGWLPRSVYAKIKFEEAANDYLQCSTHKEAVEHREQHRPEESISDTVNSLASIYVMSLDADDGLEVADENQVDLEQHTTLYQVRAHMRRAINGLPPKEKQLIMMYYFQNRTLEEAGAKLGLSKSWTSRLHARALELLMRQIRTSTGEGPEEGEPASGEDTGALTEATE